jgi:hypothetical protein
MNHGIEYMQSRKEKVIKILAHMLQALGLLLFYMCLFQDSFYRSKGYPTEDSAALLVIGYFGLLDGIVAWFANPALLAAWIYFYLKRFKISLFFSFLAFCLIVSFFFQKTISVNEAGTMAEITGYGLGFWLWLASSVASTVAAIIGTISFKKITT